MESKVKKVFFELGGDEYQAAQSDYNSRMEGKCCEAFHSKALTEVSNQVKAMFEEAGFSAKANFEPFCFHSGFHHPRVDFNSRISSRPTQKQAREIIKHAMEKIPFILSADITLTHTVTRAKTPAIA